MSIARDLSPKVAAEFSRILLSGENEAQSVEVSAFSDSVQTVKKIWLLKNYDTRVRNANEYISKDFSVYSKKMNDVIKIRETLDGL